MPLLSGKKNVGHNIKEMVSAGHPRDQAIAASLREAGVSKKKKLKKSESWLDQNPHVLSLQSRFKDLKKDEDAHTTIDDRYTVYARSLGDGKYQGWAYMTRGAIPVATFASSTVQEVIRQLYEENILNPLMEPSLCGSMVSPHQEPEMPPMLEANMQTPAANSCTNCSIGCGEPCCNHPPRPETATNLFKDKISQDSPPSTVGAKNPNPANHGVAPSILKSENNINPTIGKTKSGKHIYRHFNHPEHKNFTSQDHADAASLHRDLMAHHETAMRDASRQNYFDIPTADRHMDELQEHSRNEGKHSLASLGVKKSEEDPSRILELFEERLELFKASKSTIPMSTLDEASRHNSNRRTAISNNASRRMKGIKEMLPVPDKAVWRRYHIFDHEGSYAGMTPHLDEAKEHVENNKGHTFKEVKD